MAHNKVVCSQVTQSFIYPRSSDGHFKSYHINKDVINCY